MKIECWIGASLQRAQDWALARTAEGCLGWALPAVDPFRMAARLLEEVGVYWRNQYPHATEADLEAAWRGKAEEAGLELDSRLAIAWLGSSGTSRRAEAAIELVFGVDGDFGEQALRAAWRLLDVPCGLLWQAEDARAAADAVWTIESGTPWPGPCALGVDANTLHELRSVSPRAAARLELRSEDRVLSLPVVEGEAEEVQRLAQIARDALRVASVSGIGSHSLAEGTACSAAEAFLAAVLARRTSTAGRFVLNGRPGFDFGSLPCHVDLLDKRDAIALEIDGPHHFLDDEAFRRDRRKDLLLQRHGYVVLRFLAADVVEHLENVLATIEDTIAWKEKSRP